MHPQKKREVRPAGRKDVYFFIFEKQFCCAVVTNNSIKVNFCFMKLPPVENVYVYVIVIVLFNDAGNYRNAHLCRNGYRQDGVSAIYRGIPRESQPFLQSGEWI